MQRFVVLAGLSIAGLFSVSTRAQSPVDVQQGFSYCTATDMGSAQAKIWASPVFAVTYRRSDVAAMERLNTIAAEFLQHLYTLGGAGEKSCTLHATQAEAEASREQERVRWSKRLYFVKLGDWRDVAWTPAPWDPSKVAATPAQAMKYFRCYVTQTDIPDRSDRGRTVASSVFAMPVPGNDPMAQYAQANAYQEQFKPVVRAQGVSDEGVSCLAHDSQAEADKALVDYRRLFKGFNMKYVEVAWTPSAQPATPPTPATTPAERPAAMAPSPTSPANPVDTAAPVNPVAVAGTKAPAGGQYCTASVRHLKPLLSVRIPVWEVTAADSSHEAMVASLATLTQAVIQAYPGKWKIFPPAQCFDSSGIHGSGTGCSSILPRTFGVGTQMAFLFCHSTREMIDKQTQQLDAADGGHSQVFEWPR